MSKNPILNPRARDITGPVNIVRLEGIVHGVKKVIYMFMDYHIPVSDQTQCTNIFSPDVQKYFANSFYKLNKADKMYDFFLEIYPSELAERGRKNVLVDHRDKYIEEVVKFFRKLFIYDPKKNKVSINKIFKNVRLHYIDIRDYYKINIFERVAEMKDIGRSFLCNDNINLDSLDRIISLMYIMRDHLQLIIDILSSDDTKKKPKTKIIRGQSYNINVDALEYLSAKIKESYNHDDIRDEMNRLLELNIENFESTVEDIDNAIDRFTEYSQRISDVGNTLVRDESTVYLFNYGLTVYTMRNMIMDIANTTEMLVDDKFVEYFARFIDIYFLRRFLDKDYITNAITYTDALHSNTYIHELVTAFDFKITHASYSKIKNINELNEEIKKRSLMEIQDLILPPVLEQCADMSYFPDNFD